MDQDEAWQRLQAFVGRRGRTATSPDPVNPAMIRHWCVALGDRNPVYLDESFAKRSIHRGIIAPPTMLQAWTMPWEGIDAPVHDAVSELYAALDELGYESLIGTNSEQEYARPARPGDELSATKTITSISGEKNTRLGPGFFITLSIEVVDQAGELVGRQFHSVLKYRSLSSETPSSEPPAVRRQRTDAAVPPQRRGEHGVDGPQPARPRHEALAADQVRVGDGLPPLHVPITRTFIVSSAIASRDYAAWHHDPDAARGRGMDDVFTNLMTGNGLVGRFITDWTGPNAILRKVGLRLGVPNYPGDVLALTGDVGKKETGEHGTDLEVAVTGCNDRGEHLRATVVVRLP